MLIMSIFLYRELTSYFLEVEEELEKAEWVTESHPSGRLVGKNKAVSSAAFSVEGF